MYLILPLVLVLFCLCYRESKSLPLIFIGFMSAVIFCAVRMIFFFDHRIIHYSYMANFLYLLFRETLLPSLILYGVFFLISKDEMKYKISAIFPLEISFYIAFLPYQIINSSALPTSSFYLIIKPLIFIIMFATINIFAHDIYVTPKNKENLWKIILFSFLILVALGIPAAIESLYLVTTCLWLSILCTVAFAGYGGTRLVFMLIEKLKEN